MRAAAIRLSRESSCRQHDRLSCGVWRANARGLDRRSVLASLHFDPPPALGHRHVISRRLPTCPASALALHPCTAQAETRGPARALRAVAGRDGRGHSMPERETIRRARRDKREGKAASTQAGEFIKEEMHHIREGKHGARSTRQAIAIGLSKARSAGVALPPPPKGRASADTRRAARRASARGRAGRAPSARRSRASLKALRREGHAAASHAALSRQAHRAAARRGPGSRAASAKQAVRTKGPEVRARAARKAARTRKARAS